MEAESLNIKLRLDLSNVTSGVKKVKTQLTGMAKSVKDSIPQIKREGDKAEKSLDGVSIASKKVQKSVEGIGKEAKDSIGKIYTESAKVASRLKGVKFSTGTVDNQNTSFDNSTITQGTNEANESLEGLRNTMQSLVRLDFIGILSQNFSKLKDKVKSSVAPIKDDLKQLFVQFKNGSEIVKRCKIKSKNIQIVLKSY